MFDLGSEFQTERNRFDQCGINLVNGIILSIKDTDNFITLSNVHFLGFLLNATVKIN